MKVTGLPIVAVLILIAGHVARASDLDELKIKRKEVFAFTQEPRVVRQGRDFEIEFAVQDYCDATVVVEGPDKKIIRHLAAGVLGQNAPEPFQRGTLKQSLLWDGKNDRQEYVEHVDDCAIRVSLGLKAEFERTLFWEPKKRIGAGLGSGIGTSFNTPAQLLAAAPEGVYVFEGHGVDQLKLFGHDGKYLRTIYPFPSDKLSAVQGLNMVDFPQDDKKLPYKWGCQRSTLLSSGSTAQYGVYIQAQWGTGSELLAVRGSRLALGLTKLNRLSTDGSSGGLNLTGPKISYLANMLNSNRPKNDVLDVGPLVGAFSPDGKYLYLTGYIWRDGVPGRSLCRDAFNCVTKLEYDKDTIPQLFLGSDKQDETGSGDKQLKSPASVACDKQGRVYVADYGNNRIQVASPDGQILKSIPVSHPVKVCVDPVSDEIHVFSWLLQNDSLLKGDANSAIPATYTRLGTVDHPGKTAQCALPLPGYQDRVSRMAKWGGLEYRVEVDFWSNPPTVWIAANSGGTIESFTGGVDNSVGAEAATGGWAEKNVRVYKPADGKLECLHDFGSDVAKSIVRSRPPFFQRQRLYVSPKTGKLYVGEGDPTRWFKAFQQLVEIDPANGQCRLVDLPLSAEDMAFDNDGLMYLRTNTAIARFDPETWREVPFDYGEEFKDFTFSDQKNGPRIDLMSGLPLGAETYVSQWHNGGLSVSPKGYIVVPSIVDKAGFRTWTGKDEKSANAAAPAGGGYEPPLYPGRARFGEVHVYDKHGKRIYQDAVPGIRYMLGIAMDSHDDIYVLTHETRMYNGAPYFNVKTGTLLKLPPCLGKFMTDKPGGVNPPVPLTSTSTPKRPPELMKGDEKFWVDGVKWLFGGVGFAGKGDPVSGGGCSCWNARFALDYFGRSFVPEIDHYSVAVLDSAGNLMMRIGKYGNADDGKPLQPDGGSPVAHSIGGDEVALFHAAYLAVDSDNRLFIADAGNSRILSVKLVYNTNSRTRISDITSKNLEARAPLRTEH